MENSEKQEGSKRGDNMVSSKKEYIFIKSDENYYSHKAKDADGPHGTDEKRPDDMERETFKRCSSAKCLKSKKIKRLNLGHSAERKFREGKKSKITPKMLASTIMIKKA